MFVKFTHLGGSEIYVNPKLIVFVGSDDRSTYVVLSSVGPIFRVKEDITEVTKRIYECL